MSTLNKEQGIVYEGLMKSEGKSLLTSKGGCVDKDTEFLTHGGWKKISDYEGGDNVCQWFENGDTKFVIPRIYHKIACKSLTSIKTKTMDMTICREHRIPYYSNPFGPQVSELKAMRLNEMLSRSSITIPRHFNIPINSKGVKLSDHLIKVLIMQSAEGLLIKYKSYMHVRLSIKNDRKKILVVKLLEAANIKYETRISYTDQLVITYIPPEEIAYNGLVSLFQANKRQAIIIYNALILWSGHKLVKTNSIIWQFTGVLKDAELCQYIWSAVSANYVSLDVDNSCKNKSETYYKVSLSNKNKTCIQLKPNGKNSLAEIKEVGTSDGFKYCFTVPSSFWLARKNGKIFPTGNCGKSFLTAKVILDKAVAGEHITIVAPSHTARSVLEKELTQQCDGDTSWGGVRHKIATMTVAAALGKRPDYSKAPKNYKDTPFVTTTNSGRLRENCPQGKPRILICEEISMVGKIDLENIVHQWGKAPLLMVGDFRQIPPVNAVGCRSWLASEYKAGRLEHFKLVENMRSAKDTNIAGYSDKVFDNGDLLAIGDGFPGVVEYTEADKFETVFNKTVNVSGGGVIAIAYRNTTVNRYMRLASGGNMVDIQGGDIVRLHEGITIDYQDMDGKWQNETVANNGDAVRVKEFVSNSGEYIHPLCFHTIEYGTLILDIPHPDPFKLGEFVELLIPARIDDGSNAGKKGAYGRLFGELLEKVTLAGEALLNGENNNSYVMDFYKGMDGFDSGVRRIFDTYDNRFGVNSSECNRMKRNLLFGRCFFGERSRFVNVTKLYSLTAHKSQGQSINVVFADLRDIANAKSEERKHLAYVACSRAVNELHVLY